MNEAGLREAIQKTVRLALDNGLVEKFHEMEAARNSEGGAA